MNSPSPLSSPDLTRRSHWRRKLFIGLALLPSLVAAVVIVLSLLGWLKVLGMPTKAMTPTLNPGDFLVMENVSYQFRKPRRGDIVTFKTDGIPTLQSGHIFCKRLVGEPGDHLRIADGKLYINGTHVKIATENGEVVYNLPPSAAAYPTNTDLTIPADAYFVVGDNAINSFDSRFWGTVPHGNISGRIFYRYWPRTKIGSVR